MPLLPQLASAVSAVAHSVSTVTGGLSYVKNNRPFTMCARQTEMAGQEKHKPSDSDLAF